MSSVGQGVAYLSADFAAFPLEAYVVALLEAVEPTVGSGEVRYLKFLR